MPQIRQVRDVNSTDVVVACQEVNQQRIIGYIQCGEQVIVAGQVIKRHILTYIKCRELVLRTVQLLQRGVGAHIQIRQLVVRAVQGRDIDERLNAGKIGDGQTVYLDLSGVSRSFVTLDLSVTVGINGVIRQQGVLKVRIGNVHGTGTVCTEACRRVLPTTPVGNGIGHIIDLNTRQRSVAICEEGNEVVVVAIVDQQRGQVIVPTIEFNQQWKSGQIEN